MTENQKKLLQDILFNLVFGVISETDIIRAQILLENYNDPPVWLSLLSDGNTERLSGLQEETIRFMCAELLAPMGKRVASQKEVNDV